MYASGSTIDCVDERLERLLGRSSRTRRACRGPAPPLPVAFAARQRVAGRAAVLLEDQRPACQARWARCSSRRGGVVVDGGAGAALFCCCLSHVSNAAGSITIAWLRMSEWPSPQSSVQIERERAEPGGRDVQLRDEPGDDVLLLTENSGTKNEWMTSSDAHVELDRAALRQPQHRARRRSSRRGS